MKTIINIKQDSASDLLATVRCQAGTRRIWLRLRVASTNSTVLESTRVLIYALPTGAPRVARLLSIKLPALPYYSQHEEFDENNDHSIKLVDTNQYIIFEYLV